MCAALLVTGAGAADVYEVEGDTSSFSLVKSSAYDVVTTSVTETEMENLFTLFLGTTSPLYKFFSSSSSYSNLFQVLHAVLGTSGSTQLADYLSAISSDIDGFDLRTSSPLSTSLGGYLSSIKSTLNSFYDFFEFSGSSPFYYSGNYLNSSGNSSYTTSSVLFGDVLADGFLGLSTNIKALNTAFDFSAVVSAVNSNTTAVGKVESAVDDVVSAVDDTTSAVNATTSAVNATTSAVNATTSAVEDNTTAVNTVTSAVEDNTTIATIIANRLIEFTGNSFLYSNGEVASLSSNLSLSYLVRHGLLGLRVLINNEISAVNSVYNSLMQGSGLSYLYSSGSSELTTSPSSLSYINRHGFLGLQKLLIGDSDLVYSGSLIDNQNQSSSFSVSGLGPMLQKYLQEIQNDSGLLTYIFASPEDLEMKENSASNMSSVNDTFISPDSSTSVSASDIGSLGSAAGSIEGLGQTGVTPDQAFTQLSNDSIFEFFTATTAGNLDTTVSTFARGDLSDDPSKTIVTDYYEQSRIEFYDLIGEGVG